MPLGNSTWEDVIQAIKKEFNALVGLMMIIRPNQVPVVIATVPYDDSQLITYGEYYHSVDPWNDRLTSDTRPPNVCYPTNIMMDDKDFYKTEYYNDFWKPYGLYHSCGGLLITKNNISIVFGLPRERSSGPFENSEALLMTFYGRQIARALELEGVFGNSLPNKIYEHSLASSYGLTRAESRLVLELFKCGSLPQVSKSLNRSYHTVRNQMKSILRKTETTNQIELFKLLTTNK